MTDRSSQRTIAAVAGTRKSHCDQMKICITRTVSPPALSVLPQMALEPFGKGRRSSTGRKLISVERVSSYNIRVNAVSPGTIDTDFHASIKATKPVVSASWKNNILLKRLGQPEEAASVIEFLVSEKASFLTGEIIQINGGQDFL